MWSGGRRQAELLLDSSFWLLSRVGGTALDYILANMYKGQGDAGLEHWEWVRDEVIRSGNPSR